MKQSPQQHWFQQLTGFDYFVLAGAAINILVVLYLFSYWLFFGQ
ncbi:MAG: hypothetical protein V3R76_10235 [Gammaproteobacteria bacterium]